ncbi:acyl-CoA dehydrogenase family protein [Streptomyces sp. NPDC094154]|uniref:acyl-CoA dehydrogenase family protein n=1 Tax=Streptomyces sp. NPDC094154 TaxID=3366059 RepID=UPI0037F69FCC
MLPSTPPKTLSPYLTGRNTLLWQEADAFAAMEVAPRVARMEASPRKVERKLAQMMAARRWFAVTIPESYGGMGAGHVAKTVLIHRIATVSAATAAILQASLIPVGALLHYGTHEQKKAWLPWVADGSTLPSIAVTEPEAGGHIGGMETTAKRDGDSWVITGSKLHIGNSHLAGVHIVVARTAPPGTHPSRALTAFLVERDRRGVTVEPHEAGLGLHGFSAGRLDLAYVRIPAGNVLGQVGQGMNVAQRASILYGRPNLTAVSLGLHEAIVDTTVKFLRDRPRYGGSLSDVPVVRDRLGAMLARFRAARAYAYTVAHLLNRGVSCDSDLISAKLLGHQWAVESGREAMELHGAAALNGDSSLQRLWRDVQYTYAPAGTGEVQRIHLARAALGEVVIDWSEQAAAEAKWGPSDPTAA